MPGQVAGVLTLGLAAWMLDCSCLALSFLAVGALVPWEGLLLAYGAGQLAANLPITPGGLGVVEGSLTRVAGFGRPGMAMYGASRAARELLTRAWAAEYGPRGVRVNAVAPGPVRTPMNEGVGDIPQQIAALAPARRLAEPEELGAAIAYLASDDASFVHGVTIPVDGGRTAY